MNDPRVFWLDGVASPAECRMAIEICRQHAQVGGGYDGDPHPHHPRELFLGLDVRALPSPHQAFMLRLIQKMVMVSHAHYGPLGWGYAALSWRIPLVNDNSGLSHPFHRDDQNQTRDGWRTHSAVLHLNEGFQGGALTLETGEGTGEAITPRAGRVIGFPGGSARHGVTRLVGGERFALVVWMATPAALAARAKPAHAVPVAPA